MNKTRCVMHQDLHIARTKDAGQGSVCGHKMASGGYALCHDCSVKEKRCMLCNELVEGGAEPPASPTK